MAEEAVKKQINGRSKTLNKLWITREYVSGSTANLTPSGVFFIITLIRWRLKRILRIKRGWTCVPSIRPGS